MKVIEFFGVPSSGKSVFASNCYVDACKKGIHSGLVTEYVKSLAERQIKINSEDQFFIVGNQTKAEVSKYHANYKYIFTDSPAILGSFYSVYYNNGIQNPFTTSLYTLTLSWESFVKYKYNIDRIRIFLSLNKDWFIQEGRYQSLDQCLEMEAQLKNYVLGFDPSTITIDHRSTEKLFDILGL